MKVNNSIHEEAWDIVRKSGVSPREAYRIISESSIANKKYEESTTVKMIVRDEDMHKLTVDTPISEGLGSLTTQQRRWCDRLIFKDSK